MEEPMRVRVVFKGLRVLRKSQRSEGLKRCWILLSPELTTFSDLASHITHCFGLHRSCPNGLILSMDGFVLPSFESTCILKDKDIISVRKKGGSLKKVIETGDDGHHIHEYGIVEKQPLPSSNKFLAIKEFSEKSDGYISQDDDNTCTHHENTITVERPSSENTNSRRKRKDSNMLQGFKSKKLKPNRLENPDVTTNISESNHIVLNSICSGGVIACKDSQNKNKISNGDDRVDALGISHDDNCVKNTTSSVPRKKRRKKLKSTIIHNPEVIANIAENHNIEPSQSSPKAVTARKRLHGKNKMSKGDGLSDAMVTSNDQVEIICERNTFQPHVSGVMEKQTSRNARRKKNMRQWRREMLKSKTEETPEHINTQVSTNDISNKSPEHQTMDTNDEVEDELVPIIVRPGHIRFGPVDAEPSKQQSNGPMEHLQWNGTTSKKKGQKWGREKTLSWRDQERGDCSQESNEKSIAEVVNPVNGHEDFEGLAALTRDPKEGEVIVYRMVELSSSWCPELSSFRVGKVSSYNSTSMTIVLDTVPEYPIFHGERKEEEESVPVSSYKEDGSLEIDYPSLVDVRLLRGINGASEKIILEKETSAEKAAPSSSNWELALLSPALKEGADSAATGGEVVQKRTGWEQQINTAIVERKAELEKKKVDCWGSWAPAKDTTTPPLSYRALRRSALGPTLAMLRSTK